MEHLLDLTRFNSKSGERVALIGPSGGGKTMLTKLLLPLYGALCGCILVDDRHIKDIRLRSLREHIILVPQVLAGQLPSHMENVLSMLRSTALSTSLEFQTCDGTLNADAGPSKIFSHFPQHSYVAEILFGFYKRISPICGMKMRSKWIEMEYQ